MRKKKSLLVIGILIGVFFVVGISYAAWVKILEQTSENIVSLSCFNVTFTDENPIQLQRAYPMVDEDGKKLTPYTFTIQNNCQELASYQINLEVLNNSTLENYRFIKTMLDEKKYQVVAVEVDDNDFVFLNDKTLKHTNHMELQSFITMNYNVDVILVDLNDKGSVNLCSEVLYLIEPGLIKLNKLIRKDRQAFEKLKGKKIILNRSVLNSSDVADFEYESRSKIYYNVPYLDDKLDSHKVLDELLIKLGFSRLDIDNGDKGGKLFSIFK